jgi:hypothetical protein
MLGHVIEELKRGNHTFEDRLGVLKGKCQHERCVRLGPSRNEEGDEPAAVDKVDVNVAEIGLEPLPWKVRKRNKYFLMTNAVLQDISLNLGVAIEVAVLVVETTIHLRGGMPLLGWSLLAIDQDLVNDRMQPFED